MFNSFLDISLKTRTLIQNTIKNIHRKYPQTLAQKFLSLLDCLEEEMLPHHRIAQIRYLKTWMI